MTLNSIKTGDIIEVDKKGRRFHAQVRSVNGDVEFTPLAISGSISYRTASAREVVGHWRASKATRQAKGLEA